MKEMPSECMAPLGILGGTFDPIHIAHLRLAQEALEACALGSVRFVPAGQPSHRDQPRAAAKHRLAMARLALEGCPRFELDDAEVLNNAPSYTVPTLERLRKVFGAERPLVLLLGMDAFLGLESWHRWRELFNLAHIVVATRPGNVMDFTKLDVPVGTSTSALGGEVQSRYTPAPEVLSASAAGRISQFGMTSLDISATAIRAGLATGKSPRFLVPSGVLDYIEDNRLYI
jgi:nicotinate-nucleotide adenylyltransferase